MPSSAIEEHAAPAIVLGGVVLSLSTSATASLFHAVDQMSAWSPFSHPQYSKWKPPDAEPLLARQRELRARRGWGGGLEAVFYVDASSPADAAARAPRPLVADAREEADILEAMRPALAGHLGEASERRARELRDALLQEREAFDHLLRSWLAILDLYPPRERVPIVFVTSPGTGVGGGGANGGVVVIEVPEEGTVRATLTTVGHELVHALGAPRRDVLERAARGCGLDFTTMGEALAYAVAPGSFAYGEAIGGLERGVARNSAEAPYGKFSRLATAVRSDMRDALQAAAAGKRGGLEDLASAVCRAASTMQ
jgi:hypothetical protein